MRLLYATDGSDSSVQGARFLTSFTFASEDEIIVVHCVDLFPFSHEAAIAYSYIEQIKQELAPQILDATVEVLNSVKARISTAILTGYPGKSIIDAAQEDKLTLL